MSNERAFRRQIAKFNAEVEEASERTIKRGAAEMFTRIVNRTPVDTGRARNAWQIEGDEDFRLGDTIRILNPTEYAPILERGSSKQAPRGMVAVTIGEIAEIFRKAVNED